MLKLLFLLLGILFINTITYAAQPYKASLAFLKFSAENKDKGILVDLVKYWAEIIQHPIDITVSPFPRSLNNVISQHTDFHLPLIKNPYKKEEELQFDYSTASLFTVNFVLYTNKNRPIDIKNIQQYIIYTDRAHSDLFNFKVHPITHIDSALYMLNVGRIDGFIFADVEVDPLLKQLKFKTIQRQLFKVYDVHAVLPKGKKGGEIDKMIQEAMNTIKRTQQWEKLLGKHYPHYQDWQP